MDFYIATIDKLKAFEIATKANIFLSNEDLIAFSRIEMLIDRLYMSKSHMIYSTLSSSIQLQAFRSGFHGLMMLNRTFKWLKLSYGYSENS